jgi:solute carrier family 25 phosphate transporter 23/24/25/41
MTIDSSSSSASSESHPWLNAAKYLTAGGVAGVISRTIASPFERLKILYQVQDLATASGKKYGGIVSSLVQMGREEGIRGYFKGNMSNIVRVVPYSAVQFVSYEEFKTVAQRIEGSQNLSTPGRLLAGAMAGVASTVASYPLDLCRGRLSAQSDFVKYKGIVHCLTTIYKEEGPAALFRGMMPTIYGIAPYVGVNFACYEWLKTSYATKYNNEAPGVVTKLAMGAASGSIAQTIAYPLDTIRRKFQLIGFRDKNEVPPFRTTAEGFRYILARDGVAGLYRGLLPNYLKVVPVVSITFVVYEWMKDVLHMQHKAGEM